MSCITPCPNGTAVCEGAKAIGRVGLVVGAHRELSQAFDSAGARALEVASAGNYCIFRPRQICRGADQRCQCSGKDLEFCCRPMHGASKSLEVWRECRVRHTGHERA